MRRSTKTTFPVLRPSLQISFFHRLREVRARYLHEALRQAVAGGELTTIDRELAGYVPKKHLRRVASFGLRGEVFFPVPCLLAPNPHLLGYYRLLFGLSQKEFFSKGPFGRFRRLEEQGELPAPMQGELPNLCRSLVGTAAQLVDGIDELSLTIVHELQLLTLGPQFRGRELTRIGKDATERVFKLFQVIAQPCVRASTPRRISLQNAAGRTVHIEFASDPDIRITEQLASRTRPLVSIEIKGGQDVSNIHNRLGEAEKSHQKAKGRGFFEFWTILAADVDPAKAKRESPTTSHFFHLTRIADPDDPEHRAFREIVCSMLGIPGS